ncbi:MAG: hypothetical protein R3C19_16595 [Planctomycetaceae bacterium]
MSWRKKQDETNRLRHWLAVGGCTVVGGFIGATMGLGVCVYLLSFTILFPGDTIVAGAIICGTFGFIYGEPFLDWLLENFRHFV